MKRKGTGEISVYSTSAIDLFCSAMGVFMVICFIAFAQQQQTSPPEPQPDPVPPAPVQPPPPPEPAPPAPEVKKKGLSTPIMIAQCEWKSCSDIDLVVRYCPPQGQAIWFCFDGSRSSVRRRTHEGFYGGLLHDEVSSPSPQTKTEQWAVLANHPGKYEVYLVMYVSSASPTETKVQLMTEDSEEKFSRSVTIPSKVLLQDPTAIEQQYRNRISSKEMVPAGCFIVQQQGSSYKIVIKKP